MSQIWGEKEGGQDKFWGKVSGPVGVSSRVQPLWLGKEGEEEGGGRGGREQPGSAAVWSMCRLDFYACSVNSPQT